jgi:MFS family permease
LRAIQHREFRTVWGTFLVGHFGFWVAFIALQALMSRLTGADGTWQGLLFFTNFIPMLLLTPISGVVADRVERRRVLLTTFSLMCVVMSLLGVLTLMDLVRPVTLLPFAFAVGTLFSFNAPAGQAIVANAVPRSDLSSAIGLQSGGMNLARVVGPTLAAPILAVWNEGAAFLIYAVASLIVVGLLSRLHLTAHVPEADDGNFLRRVRRGLGHARSRPPAVHALSVLAASSLFAGGYLALLPVVADREFGRGPSGFAVLAAVTGAGSMLGALTTTFREGAPSLRTVALLVAGFGASVALFSQAPTWPLAMAAIVVVGFFYFAGVTTLQTLVQHVVAEEMRGRVSSLFVIGWAGLIPIAGLWQGVFASIHGARATMLLAGSLTAVYSLAMALAGWRLETHPYPAQARAGGSS